MSSFSWPPEWSGTERMQLGHWKVNQPVHVMVISHVERNFASPLNLIPSSLPLWAVGTEIIWQLFAVVVNLEIIQWAVVGSQGFWQLPEASAILWCYKSPRPCDATPTAECQKGGVPDTLWCGERHQPLSVPPSFCCDLIVWGIGRTINKRD